MGTGWNYNAKVGFSYRAAFPPGPAVPPHSAAPPPCLAAPPKRLAAPPRPAALPRPPVACLLILKNLAYDEYKLFLIKHIDCIPRHTFHGRLRLPSRSPPQRRRGDHVPAAAASTGRAHRGQGSVPYTALVTVNNQFPGLKLVGAEYLGFWDSKNVNSIKIVLGLCPENCIKDS